MEMKFQNRGVISFTIVEIDTSTFLIQASMFLSVLTKWVVHCLHVGLCMFSQTGDVWYKFSSRRQSYI